MSLLLPDSVWTVHVENWKWIYSFSRRGTVNWRDPFNGMKGAGSWRVEKGRLIIRWSRSKSWDDWDWPVNPRSQYGYCNSGGNTYDLWAEAQKYYLEPGDVVEFEGKKYVVYPDEVRAIGSRGTVAWVCRNPGNIRSGEEFGAYKNKQFQTRSAGAFAIFPDEETGMKAIVSVLKRYGHVTITQAINKYAPRGDGANDPEIYGRSVAKGLGVPASTYVDTLKSEQLESFAKEIKKVEGWQEGEIFARGDERLPEAVRRLMAPRLHPPTEEEIRNSSIGRPW